MREADPLDDHGYAVWESVHRELTENRYFAVALMTTVPVPNRTGSQQGQHHSATKSLIIVVAR